ncbi:MAG: MEDS domain-containing protein [Chitinispirillaceae bacterium]|nr:MEDS domain-containing protein [Chitinispirillaceae bacterium]
MNNANPARQSGIEAVGPLPWGSHFCQFYDTTEDLIDTLVPYFRAGLEANEFCMWVTSEPLEADAARDALAAGMPDLDQRIAQGRIEILDYSEWYTKSGAFRADEVMQGWRDKLDSALAKGFDGLRLTGNTFWLEKNVWADFTKYEETVNTALAGANIIALCTYSLRKCGALEIAEVIANHEFALIKHSGEWQIIKSVHQRKMEQSLRESEERYRSLYSAMGEGMALHEIVRDDEGRAMDYRIIDVNPAFERITGIGRETAVNALASRLYGAGEPPYLDIYSRVAETGTSESFETNFSPMTKSFRIAVFSSAKGRFATVFEDITDRKRNEAGLKRAHDELESRVMERTAELQKTSELLSAERQRLFDVLETLPVMTCLLTPDYHVTWANRSFREKFGESGGRCCYEYCFGKSKPCEFCETYTVISTGKPHHWEVRSPDGGVIDAYDFPFRDVDGSQLILEMDIDVTEQKRLSERLHSASLYSRSLIEASLDPLVTISPEGKITDVNEATVAATGVDRERLIDTDFSDYFTEPEKAREGYRRVFDKRFVTDYPLTIRHKDGRLTDVLYNASVYKDPHGGVIGVFAAARDITAKKAAEAELEKYRIHLEELVKLRTRELEKTNLELKTQVSLREKTAEDLAMSNRDLEQFAYAASHDLQEPLRAIGGFVELLKQQLDGTLDSKKMEYMDFIIDGVARMQSLINGLLEYSRVETRGKEPARVDAKTALDHALFNLQAAIKESGANIVVDSLPEICADQTQLSQLFQNLIGNAIKFRSSAAPEISVSASRDNGAWKFAVSDNGIGIEPHYAERIFLLFQRLHTRKKYPGTGIGLAICKKIVERHGGRIWVESDPGTGTTFCFTIHDKG